MAATEKKIGYLKNVYYITCNTLIVILMLVAGSHLYLAWRSTAEIDNFAQNFSKERRAAYGHMTDQEVNDLLNSTWNPSVGGWQYDDWVGFVEAPRKTRFVNVNEYGIRQNSSSPLDMEALNDSIWFFGGSTTFGYGVADNETIPAQLEKVVDSKVVNLGRGYFYSAQENQLLTEYLKAGYRPKAVIFLDGVNERCDIEVYQKEMASLFEKAATYSWDLADALYPVTVLSGQIQSRLGLDPVHGDADISQNDLHGLSCSSYGETLPLSYVLQQNMSERKFICEDYGLDCKTYVQPFAGVHGIHSDYKTYKASDREMIHKKFDFLKPVWADLGSTFVTDALDGLHKHAYVDDCHYSAEACGLIANAIAKDLDQTGAL